MIRNVVVGRLFPDVPAEQLEAALQALRVFVRLGLLVGAVLAGAAAFAVLVATGLLTIGFGNVVADTARLVGIGVVFAVAGWFVVRRTPV
ncbi:MAG: hypothetical protein L0I24_17935 [Pseudonocardia sp.]|nr:hypothetical protein [Pseudonocardia sp.]